MLEEFLLNAARRALEAASDADRLRFLEIIRGLCASPEGSLVVGTLPDDFPNVVYQYSEDEYWVMYDLPDDATLRVWLVAKGPLPRRS